MFQANNMIEWIQYHEFVYKYSYNQDSYIVNGVHCILYNYIIATKAKKALNISLILQKDEMTCDTLTECHDLL